MSLKPLVPTGSCWAGFLFVRMQAAMNPRFWKSKLAVVKKAFAISGSVGMKVGLQGSSTVGSQSAGGVPTWGPFGMLRTAGSCWTPKENPEIARFCLACGSQAVIGLSRVLGGSLRRQGTAHLIADAELDRLVRELLRTVPAASAPDTESHLPVSFATLAPGRSHVRCTSQLAQGVAPAAFESQRGSAEIDLEPAISVIAERAQTLTGASGAAIALRKGDEMVCRARSGRTAPDLGVRLQSDSGISADCVRTGEVVLCHDAQDDPHVDLAACQRLGVRSILAAPLRHFRRTLGVFEVFSAAPYAFAARDVASMQLLSSVMVAAISRLSTLQLSPRRQTA